jgi:zinc transporter ZupT
MTLKQALLYNFLSAGTGFVPSCSEIISSRVDFAEGSYFISVLYLVIRSPAMCYGGLVVGIILGNLQEAATYIFGLAAGIFLYIALADMVSSRGKKKKTSVQ